MCGKDGGDGTGAGASSKGVPIESTWLRTSWSVLDTRLSHQRHGVTAGLEDMAGGWLQSSCMGGWGDISGLTIYISTSAEEDHSAYNSEIKTNNQKLRAPYWRNSKSLVPHTGSDQDLLCVLV